MSNVTEQERAPEDPLDRWWREREEPRPRERRLDTAQITVDDIDRRIEERVAAEHNFMIDIMAEVLVKLWTPETVYYEGDVVAYDGGTFQAKRDTGQPPSHAHWICLATAGRDGNSITVRGTFSETAEYRCLDVVALSGGSFVALKDAPGPCPGSGWQLLASQGKRGVAGARGERGPTGLSGATIRDWKIDRARYVATPLMSDGREGPPLELRGLFEQFLFETR